MAENETPGVKPGMFGGGAPTPAMPVAGPGMPAPAEGAAPAKRTTAPAKPKRAARKPATRKATVAKGRKRSRPSRTARAAPAPAATPAPRRGRVASIKLDMQTMMAVLGSTRKRDQEALFAIVSALNPLSKPQRVRVMEAVAALLTA